MAASGGHWSKGNFKPAAGTVAKAKGFAAAKNMAQALKKSQLQPGTVIEQAGSYAAIDKSGVVAGWTKNKLLAEQQASTIREGMKPAARAGVTISSVHESWEAAAKMASLDDKATATGVGLAAEAKHPGSGVVLVGENVSVVKSVSGLYILKNAKGVNLAVSKDPTRLAAFAKAGNMKLAGAPEAVKAPITPKASPKMEVGKTYSAKPIDPATVKPAESYKTAQYLSTTASKAAMTNVTLTGAKPENNVYAGAKAELFQHELTGSYYLRSTVFGTSGPFARASNPESLVAFAKATGLKLVKPVKPKKG